MKRYLALILALIMCLALFTGCGTKNDKDTSKDADDKAAASTTDKDTEDSEESDWEYVQDKGTFTIGITLFAPMNYYEDNELVGFDTELAKAVFDKLGLKVEFVEINWDSKEVELNSKSIDCIWNGMCITEERKENMSISDPYLNNTQAMVMMADREEEIMGSGVAGLNVVAEQGSTGEGKIDGSIKDDDTVEVSPSEYFADANYTAVDSMAKALMEVKSGLADVALVDSVCALGMVGEGTDYEDMVVNLDNNFGLQEYGIAFRKGSDITAKVNAAIAELYEEGTVQEIAAKYDLTDMLIQK
ncbi:MAG: transporter substrate-binding domain-containing protein [Oscillospiraceae bacterium]|jgi:polar amino acid transport system substrate-binding protein